MPRRRSDHPPGIPVGEYNNQKTDRTPAPKTGQVAPVGGSSKRYVVVCYKCGHPDGGEDRNDAIREHQAHVGKDHA